MLAIILIDIYSTEFIDSYILLTMTKSFLNFSVVSCSSSGGVVVVVVAVGREQQSDCIKKWQAQ